MPLSLRPPARWPRPESSRPPIAPAARVDDTALWRGALTGAIYAGHVGVLWLLSILPLVHVATHGGRASDFVGHVQAGPLLFAIVGSLAGVASAHCAERYAGALSILTRPVMLWWLAGGYVVGALCGARQLLVLWYQGTLAGAAPHAYLDALGTTGALGGWWASASMVLAGALSGGMFAVLFGWSVTYVHHAAPTSPDDPTSQRRESA